MVLPLIGLLGAGLAGTGALAVGREFLGDWAQRRQGRRVEDAIGGLLEDPNAGQLDYGQALMRGGLLSPQDFMSTAFDQENMLSQFGLDQLLAQGAATREEAKLGEGRLFELDAAFQPRFDALNTELTDLQELDRIVAQASEMSPSERSAWIGTPEGIAQMNQLAEAEERGFSRYKKEVYGEAEPPPDELERLRSTYFSATGGGRGLFLTQQGRFDQAREIYDQRAEELRRQARELEGEYYRNYDRASGGGLQVPGGLAGDVGVTRSDRNAPADVGPRAMAIGEALVGAGEVPDRELLADFISTGGQNLDPVTTAWCAAWVNAALERAGGRGTGRLDARSFLDWGSPAEEPRPGDVAVFSRGSNPAAGHVGFFQGYNPDGTIRVLGGNQADAVGVGSYPMDRLLGFRRG